MTDRTKRERLQRNVDDLRELLSDGDRELAEVYADVGARLGAKLVGNIVNSYQSRHRLEHGYPPSDDEKRRHLSLVAEAFMLACYSVHGLEMVRRLSTPPPPNEPNTPVEAAAKNYDAIASKIGHHLFALASEAIDARHRQKTGQAMPDDVLGDRLFEWAQSVLKLQVGADPFAGLDFGVQH